MGELYGKPPHYWVWGEEPPGVPPHPAHVLFDQDCTELWIEKKNTAANQNKGSGGW